MPSLATLLSDFARLAAPSVVAALWQGLAIATALALCLHFSPRLAAAQRFHLWAAAFALVAFLPFAPLAAGHLLPSGTVAAASPTRPWFAVDVRWTWVLAALWLTASALRALDLALHTVRLRSLWRKAQPVPPAALASVLGEYEAQSLPVFTTQQLDRPSVIGFFAPRILIPAWLLARLTPGELRQIVLHEREHLRRRDDWTNLLQKLCLVLFPLNPALWWIDRRLASEREMACDEGVIRITRAPRAYAACLASLAESRLAQRAQALSLGIFSHRPELVRRVHSILAGTRSLNPAAATALFAALGLGLAGGAWQLARCPQLVAFVSAQPTETAHILTGPGDALLPTEPRHGLASVHATPAMARMHTVQPHRVAPAAAPAPQLATALQPEMQPSAVAIATGASVPADRPAQPARVVILAEWREVQIYHAATRPTSDYDTGEDSSPAAGQITVTRLVLRVAPGAGNTTVSDVAPAAPAANAQSAQPLPPNASRPKPAAPAAQHKASPPPFFPFGDGWFAFQL